MDGRRVARELGREGVKRGKEGGEEGGKEGGRQMVPPPPLGTQQLDLREGLDPRWRGRPRVDRYRREGRWDRGNEGGRKGKEEEFREVRSEWRIMRRGGGGRMSWQGGKEGRNGGGRKEGRRETEEEGREGGRGGRYLRALRRRAMSSSS
jgi:hypothetical protein